MPWQQMIFNELCVSSIKQTKFSDPNTIAAALRQLAEVLRLMSRHFGINVLRVHPDFKTYMPTEQYPFSYFLSAEAGILDEDARTLIKSRIDNSRYLEDLGQIIEQSGILVHGQRSSLFEYVDSIGGHLAQGLGAAFLLNEVAVSLITEKCWLQEAISVEHVWESPDKSGSETVSVNHISQIAHLKLPIRIYEASAKHDPKTGWGSPMDLVSPEVDQVLIDAVSVDESKQIYSYSVRTKNYYVFLAHTFDHYHGFIEVEQKIPTPAKRQLRKKGLSP